MNENKTSDIEELKNIYTKLGFIIDRLSEEHQKKLLKELKNAKVRNKRKLDTVIDETKEFIGQSNKFEESEKKKISEILNEASDIKAKIKIVLPLLFLRFEVEQSYDIKKVMKQLKGISWKKVAPYIAILGLLFGVLNFLDKCNNQQDDDITIKLNLMFQNEYEKPAFTGEENATIQVGIISDDILISSTNRIQKEIPVKAENKGTKTSIRLTKPDYLKLDTDSIYISEEEQTITVINNKNKIPTCKNKFKPRIIVKHNENSFQGQIDFFISGLDPIKRDVQDGVVFFSDHEKLDCKYAETTVRFKITNNDSTTSYEDSVKFSLHYQEIIIPNQTKQPGSGTQDTEEETRKQLILTAEGLFQKSNNKYSKDILRGALSDYKNKRISTTEFQNHIEEFKKTIQ